MSREHLRTGTGTRPCPGHFWSRQLVSVPVISGPDDWSRSCLFLVPMIGPGPGHFWPHDWSWSRLNFGPGTGPGPNSGPMAW